MQEVLDLIFYRESVFLLSRFLNDPTVGILWDKKESCSTRRGLRVGTRFSEFPQTRSGRGSPYFGFILRLSTMLMFRSIEALNDRLIGSKPWNRNAWI